MWYNPLVWMAAMAGYARAHFWAWHLSSAWSWVSAFGASLAYPDWARVLVADVWPVVREAAIIVWEQIWSGSFGP